MKGLKAMPATLMLHHLWLLSIAIADVIGDDSSDFGDLGKELLGGFAIAVVIAVAYAFIKLRLRDQKPAAQFISISSSEGPDLPTKPPERQ
jgi:hypothetical protein